jgi:hypothetical protein
METRQVSWYDEEGDCVFYEEEYIDYNGHYIKKYAIDGIKERNYEYIKTHIEELMHMGLGPRIGLISEYFIILTENEKEPLFYKELLDDIDYIPVHAGMMMAMIILKKFDLANYAFNMAIKIEQDPKYFYEIMILETARIGNIYYKKPFNFYYIKSMIKSKHYYICPQYIGPYTLAKKYLL